ncbi:MAG TPA: AI-2E family transporter YdiK [Candidatus Bathyarchaeia archaeon]|nr:AI-2E family transporter YdiK [Candidatus Bathyarchaeia archaeon]
MAKETGLTWDVTRILFAVVAIGGLLAASFWVLKAFLPSAIWAVMIVVATWPEMRAVERLCRNRRGPAVAVMTALMLAIILVPIGVAVTALVDRADEIIAWSTTLTHFTMPAMPAWVGNLPLVGGRIATWWQSVAAMSPEDVASRITPHLTQIGAWLLGQAGTALALFVQLLLTMVFCAVLYAKGEEAAEWSLAFARRLAGEQGDKAVRLSGQAIRAIALGIVVTALVQSLMGGVGLFVAGVPHAVILTAVMFLLAVAQIGAIPVMVGAVIWLFWQDQTLWGAVMVVWSIITGTVDNFIRPILIKKGADLPLLLVFTGVVGGLLAFGIIGLFVGPVVLAVSYTLLLAWVDAGGDAGAEPAP